MRTIFVLSILTGALIAGLSGSDVSVPLPFAGMLAIAGLTQITWRNHFQYADLGVVALPAPAAVALSFTLACVIVGLPYLLGLGIRQSLGIG